MTTPSKRFRLAFVGPIEDQPRLLRAYGRACQGEFALVMRPSEGRALLVHVTKEGATSWRSSDAGDAPQAPSAPLTPKEAVNAIQLEQRALPKAGPTTLRGRWTGVLVCDDGAPRVELQRKLATYGTLTVRSDASGWGWSFARSKQWFSEPTTTEGTGIPTLAAAIEAGVLGAMSLVREACSLRDTQRRSAHDAPYAAEHPIQQPAPTKDPTERLRVRTSRRSPPPPRPLDEGDAPAVPATPAALDAAAEAVSAEGDALASLTGRAWLWETASSPAEVAAWLKDNGFAGLDEAVGEYAAKPEAPVERFIELLTRDLEACRTVHDEHPDPAVYAEAARQIGLLRASLTSAPFLMERARKLIRYATAVAQSPACRGKEQRDALEEARRAAHAYEEAREAILRGQPWDALKTLRRIGERAALSAAKAARSCASGQTTLPTSSRKTGERMPKAPTESASGHVQRLLREATARIGEGHHRVARQLLDDASRGASTLSSSKATRLYEQIAYLEGKLAAALTPEGWRPFVVGDRAVLDDDFGEVTWVPAGTYSPADEVMFLADGRKRGRRVEARRLVLDTVLIANRGGEEAGGDDVERDAALMRAFGEAVAAAVGGGVAG